MTSIFRFAAALLLAASALAQTPTGEISGVVRDPSGAAVPGATVSLTNENTGLSRETSTNEDGIYAAALLPPGAYSASVQAAGFRVSERTGLELSALQSLRVDFSLELGDITETVTAEAVQVDTRTASQGMLVDDRRVRDLPLNGRNVTDLARLIPGLNRINTTFTANFNQQRLFLNGTRDTSVAFLMDGSSVNYSHRGRRLNLPPPDAVQEFKVLIGGNDAEYGRDANVMSAVRRSGTNELHGSLWNFFRNDALDARNFFGADVPKLRFNQYGATGGGPIRKNRTFFSGRSRGCGSARMTFRPARFRRPWPSSTATSASPAPPLLIPRPASRSRTTRSRGTVSTRSPSACSSSCGLPTGPTAPTWSRPVRPTMATSSWAASIIN